MRTRVVRHARARDVRDALLGGMVLARMKRGPSGEPRAALLVDAAPRAACAREKGKTRGNHLEKKEKGIEEGKSDSFT